MKGIKMETIKLNYHNLLIIDPCYIKHIKDDRFDSLRCIRVLHEGDDGGYTIIADGLKPTTIGVDSGRIWVIQAEFDTEVEVDAGLSGYIVINSMDYTDYNKIINTIERR